MLDQSFLFKIFVSLSIGAVIGLERAYSKKQFFVGIRTFSLISIFGFLSGFVTFLFYFGFLSISALLILLYHFNFRSTKSIGLTTIISFILCYVLGYLIYLGYIQESIFCCVLITLILWLKEKTRDLVQHIKKEDIKDFLEFLILLGFIYPILPEKINLLGINIPILEVYSIVILLTIINFIAYLTTKRLDSKQEVSIIGFFGGLIDSTSTTFSLSRIVKKDNLLVGGALLATAGMVVRNLIIATYTLSKLDMVILLTSSITMTMLVLISLFLISKNKSDGKEIEVESPFGVKKAIKIRAYILIFIVVLNVAQHYLKNTGFFDIFVFVSAFLSTTATTISIFSSIPDPQKYFYTIILGGIFSNLIPVILTKNKKAIIKMFLICCLVSILLFFAFYGYIMQLHELKII